MTAKTSESSLLPVADKSYRVPLSVGCSRPAYVTLFVEENFGGTGLDSLNRIILIMATETKPGVEGAGVLGVAVQAETSW